MVRISLSGLQQGRPWANIIHLQYTGTAPSNSVLDTLCTQISTLWNTTLGTLINTQTSLRQIVAQDLTTSSSGTGTFVGNLAGTRAGTFYTPDQVAACITWKTALRWRGGHPRTYLPGQLASDITNGSLWASAYQTTANAAIGGWHTGLNSQSAGGNSWAHVVLRRHQTLTDGTHVPLNPAVPYPILSGFLDSRVDTQRRRLGRDVSA